MLVAFMVFIGCYTIKLMIVSIKVLCIFLYLMFWGAVYVFMALVEFLFTIIGRAFE